MKTTPALQVAVTGTTFFAASFAGSLVYAVVTRSDALWGFTNLSVLLTMLFASLWLAVKSFRPERKTEHTITITYK